MRRPALLTATALALVAVAVALPGIGAGATTGLDARERATLLSMREEEKLAHDVYVALAKTSGDARFTNIAASELRHEQALERQLALFGIADPTDGLGVGVFATEAFQRLYEQLVAKGSVSTAAALAVGVEIERLDIADLARAIAETDEPSLDRAYAALKAGSTNHLAAFTRTGTAAGTGRGADTGRAAGARRGAGIGTQARQGTCDGSGRAARIPTGAGLPS